MPDNKQLDIATIYDIHFTPAPTADRIVLRKHPYNDQLLQVWGYEFRDENFAHLFLNVAGVDDLITALTYWRDFIRPKIPADMEKASPDDMEPIAQDMDWQRADMED